MISSTANADESVPLAVPSGTLAADDTDNAEHGRPVGFMDELTRWIEPLRQSLRQLLREVGSPATPREMQHRLGVPYVACWQAFRIARAADASAEAQNAPSPGMLRGLLVAARTHGGTSQTIAAVTIAADEFHAFVTHHAGDRPTFDAMVAQKSSGGKSETSLLQRRRSAYRAMSQIWGVQTDLQTMTTIHGPPSSDGSPYNKITLTTQRGVRRLRSDAHITVAGYYSRPFGKPIDDPPIPLDPVAAAEHGSWLLPAFSSSSKNIEVVTTDVGWRYHNLVGGEVGRRVSSEFAFGFLTPDSQKELTPDGRDLHASSFTVLRRPIALLVLDVLLHRRTMPGIVPQSLVHQFEEGDRTQVMAEASMKIPGTEKTEPAGRADLLDLAEAPRYAELLKYAAGCKGWDLPEFDAYRIRIPFPLLSSVTRVFYTTT